MKLGFLEWIVGIRNMVSNLFRSGHRESELELEMENHIQLECERLIRDGMDPSEARKAVLKQFGSVEGLKEECRDSWGTRIVFDIWRDVRFGFRQMFKRKVFTGIMLATLIVCIAGNTAIFSLLHTIIIRPYAFPDADRVVNIGMQWKTSSYGDATLAISTRSYLDILESSKSFESLGLSKMIGGKVDMKTDSGMKRIHKGEVTPGIWKATGVGPLLGRLFTEEDLQQGGVNQVVLSYATWVNFFEKSADVIGETLMLDGISYTVSAVMPKDFYLMMNNTAVWLPFVFGSYEHSENSRGNNAHNIYGRLKPGVSLIQAQNELDSLYASFLDRFPEKRKEAEEDGEAYGVVLANDYGEGMVPMIGAALWSIQGAVALILIIGAFNVSGLILVRNWHRVGELTMRHSLGAKKSRIIRQLVTETVLLFLLAGLLSLPVAHAIILVIEEVVLSQMPTGLPTRLNANVLGVVFLALFLVGLVCGALPAWGVSRKGALESKLSSSRSTIGRRVHWLQNLFVVGQVGLSVVLLVTTGVLLKNVDQLMKKDFGYDTNEKYFVDVFVPNYRYGDAEALDVFREELLAKIRNLPGLDSAAYAERRPLDLLSTTQGGFEIQGFTADPSIPSLNGTHYRVSSDYFETMQIDLLQGRLFDVGDTASSAPVAIVSKSVARDFPSGESPIGRALTLWGKEYRIVGVVEDTVDYPLFLQEPRHTIFFSSRQWGRFGDTVSFVVDSSVSPSVLEPTIRKLILEVDPDLSEITFLSGSNNIREGAALHRLPAEALTCFATVAIALTLLGLYGLLTYAVTERQREFGIRIALGVSPRSLISMIAYWGAKLAVVGLILGSIGAYFLMSAIDGLLPDIRTTSLDIFLKTGLLIALVAFGAIAIPARRVLRIDPMRILRAE